MRKKAHAKLSSCLGLTIERFCLQENVLVFLHGFLGSSEDWIPIMKSISGSARCISIDLPGHGESMFQKSDSGEAAQDPTLSIEIVAHVLSALLLQISSERITLVGYSMGARIALYMALKFPDMVHLNTIFLFSIDVTVQAIVFH